MKTNLKNFPHSSYPAEYHLWADRLEKELRERLGSFENNRWKSGTGFYRARLARQILKEILGDEN